jgi:hypothetical protein
MTYYYTTDVVSSCCVRTLFREGVSSCFDTQLLHTWLFLDLYPIGGMVGWRVTLLSHRAAVLCGGTIANCHALLGG